MKKYNNLLCFGWVGLAKSIFPFLLREILLQGFSKISNERPGYQMDSFGQNFWSPGLTRPCKAGAPAQAPNSAIFPRFDPNNTQCQLTFKLTFHFARVLHICGQTKPGKIIDCNFHSSLWRTFQAGVRSFIVGNGSDFTHICLFVYQTSRCEINWLTFLQFNISVLFPFWCFFNIQELVHYR